MSDNTAILAGFTREIMARNIAREMHLFVLPSADLGGMFRAYDADNCAWVTVYGWQWNYETIANHTS